MGSEAIGPAVASPSCRLVPILENVPLARDTYRLRLDDPILARTIRPGQFLMIRPGAEGADDPLLGSPFALYDVVLDAAGRPAAVDLVYLVIGRGTACLARRKPGERLAVWGPLGNGFGPAPTGPVLFVAGGIGQTPFLALGRWWLGKMCYGNRQHEPASPSFPGSAGVFSPSATLLYGVRTAALLAGVMDFRAAGIKVEIATDDGSAGYHGLVTDLLALRLRRESALSGSSAAARWPCSRSWLVWPSAKRSLAMFRLRITWPAASGLASVASPPSARLTGPATFAGSVSRGRSSPPDRSIGRA